MRILITALAQVSFAAFGTFDVSDSYASNDLIVIKFSPVITENTPKNQGAFKFKELAELRLSGRVKVQAVPNAQLYGDTKLLQALLLDHEQSALPPSRGYIGDLLQLSGPIFSPAIERNDSKRANLKWE